MLKNKSFYIVGYGLLIGVVVGVVDHPDHLAWRIARRSRAVLPPLRDLRVLLGDVPGAIILARRDDPRGRISHVAAAVA